MMDAGDRVAVVGIILVRGPARGEGRYDWLMEVRPLQLEDLDSLVEIDATIESKQYMHLTRDVEEGEARGAWRFEERPLAETLIEPNRLDDEHRFVYRQVASGMDEGVALVLEGEDPPLLAAAVMRPIPDRRLLHLADLRVDYDHRRQGFASAILFELINRARTGELRAIYAETAANNLPAQSLLRKVGFELGGLDERRHTNHDLLKESATLLWYLPLEA